MALVLPEFTWMMFLFQVKIIQVMTNISELFTTVSKDPFWPLILKKQAKWEKVLFIGLNTNGNQISIYKSMIDKTIFNKAPSILKKLKAILGTIH